MRAASLSVHRTNNSTYRTVLRTIGVCAGLSLALACADAGAVYYQEKKNYLSSETLSLPREYTAIDVFTFEICNSVNKKELLRSCGFLGLR